MFVKDLLKGLQYEVLQGTDEVEIESISWDSRCVKEKSLFICVKGKNVDRHDFALDAVKEGAVCLVIEHEIPEVPSDIAIIKLDNSKKAMAHISNIFYGEPSKKMNIVGITGTNGKTSVSWFVAKILESANRKAGIIGTIENKIGNEKIKVQKNNPTTPDSMELQATLKEMLDEGATDVVMEVTSTALTNYRVHECKIDIGVFTNLTQDHLDEHGTMENYKNAKLKLFSMCRYGVVNIDDPMYKDILKNNSCEKLITYGIDNDADFRAVNIKYFLDGVEFTLKHEDGEVGIFFKVPGKFSVYNILAAIGACRLCGLSMEQIVKGIDQIEGVRGRFESVRNDRGFTVIIDYAHTPDGLENVLNAVKEFARGKIIAVFGCGGDRDRTKRPVMGEIAGRLADFCILTSDNPRTEDPESILNDIEQGILKTGCPYEKIVDRKSGIHRALDIAKPLDVVVIAGKGHETYQIFKDTVIHFDDREVVWEYFSR